MRAEAKAHIEWICRRINNSHAEQRAVSGYLAEDAIGALNDCVAKIEQMELAHDARAAELLSANNAEVERRRAAEAALAKMREALEPFSYLEVPARHAGNAGAYSIRHADILRARAALTDQGDEKIESASTELSPFDRKILFRASQQEFLSFSDHAGLRHSEWAIARRLTEAGLLERAEITNTYGPPPRSSTAWKITDAGRMALEKRRTDATAPSDQQALDAPGGAR